MGQKSPDKVFVKRLVTVYKIPMTMDDTRKKLLFRAWHRGTREMDLLMGSFADSFLPTCNDADVVLFEQLLAVPDPDLYDWKIGRIPPDADEDTTVMQAFIRHQYNNQP